MSTRNIPIYPYLPSAAMSDLVDKAALRPVKMRCCARGPFGLYAAVDRRDGDEQQEIWHMPLGSGTLPVRLRLIDPALPPVDDFENEPLIEVLREVVDLHELRMTQALAGDLAEQHADALLKTWGVDGLERPVVVQALRGALIRQADDFRTNAAYGRYQTAALVDRQVYGGRFGNDRLLEAAEAIVRQANHNVPSFCLNTSFLAHRLGELPELPSEARLKAALPAPEDAPPSGLRR